MKQTTIYIGGKPFTYNDEIDDISYDTISAISQEDAKHLLQTVKRLFDAKGIKYCLGFGTLLGAVRDGHIISGDEDVDIIVESKESVLDNLFFLSENGLNLCRYDGEYLFSFRSNTKAYVDVYFKRSLPICVWKIWCIGLIYSVMPRKYFSKYDSISFLGDVYPVPHKPERLLEFWYGKTWRTPLKGHKFTYDVPSHYWWVNEGKYKYEWILNRISHYLSLICRPKYSLHRLVEEIRRRA